MKRLAYLLLLSKAAFALEYSPWLSEYLECNLRANYMLQYYPSVEGAVNPSKYSSTDNFVGGEFFMRFLPEAEGLIESQWDSTKKHDMRFLTTAVQLRYQLLDDMEGDPVAFLLMGDIRYVPTHALKDVSTPYHAQCDFEVGASCGKEFDFASSWNHYLYGAALLGQANRGYPWITAVVEYKASYMTANTFGAFVNGYFGLGPEKVVDIDAFNGYARINHQSIDTGLVYIYTTKVWGSLRAELSYRALAKRYPKNAVRFLVSYTLPFSLF